jgi:hypothetical protein
MVKGASAPARTVIVLGRAHPIARTPDGIFVCTE